MKNLVDDPRLNGRLKVGRIDFQNSIQALHTERNAAVHGNGTAGQSRSGRSGRHRNPMCVRNFQDGRHLVRVFRHTNDERPNVQIFRFIVGIGVQALGVHTQALHRQNLLQQGEPY